MRMTAMQFRPFHPHNKISNMCRWWPCKYESSAGNQQMQQLCGMQTTQPDNHCKVQRLRTSLYRFSRKVLALVMFFPMALAFQAK